MGRFLPNFSTGLALSPLPYPSLGSGWQPSLQAAFAAEPIFLPTHLKSEDGSIMFLQKFGIHQQDYMVSQPTRRQQLEHSPP